VDPQEAEGADVLRHLSQGAHVAQRSLAAQAQGPPGTDIEAGARIDDFLEWFPGVSRDQVEAVLRHAELSLAQA